MSGWGGGVGGDLGLELVAKFSVLASLLVIMYFFMATTYRIARLPNGVWPFFYVHRRQELHKTATQLPFTFGLVESSIKGVVDSFEFCLKGISSVGVVDDEGNNNGVRIKCYWGVDAAYLCGLVGSTSWEEMVFKDRGDDDDDISSRGDGGTDNESDKVLLVHRIKLMKSNWRVEDSEVKVKVTTPPEVDWSKLQGQYKYPLAIFFGVKERHHGQDLNPTSIIGLCVVLHVKSVAIPAPTSILAQYIKLYNGASHKLHPLYVDVDGVAEEEQEPSSSASERGSPVDNVPFGTVMCSACQSFPVSRAIVPCGHVCLCARCFGRVSNCPFCRGPITYFFKTRSENYLQDHQE